MLPHLIQQNWLLSYETIEGIENVLIKMDNRMKRNSNMRFSIAELKTFYSEFEEEFTTFFATLITHSDLKIKTL